MQGIFLINKAQPFSWQLKKEEKMVYHNVNIDKSSCKFNKKGTKQFFIKLKSKILKLILKIQIATKGGLSWVY
ncbi:hypothetical protein [Spiroplasma melliferum]|uniref:Uncharacterized protein n=1 Tax=Spiroplasma melliferum KC3 TaxID=570509 RepID=A0AAI9T2L5_SPIME|nr:hypothetical protein [Spiroplasma melliferum]ELL44226.1 hypothetical protein SMIPMB4A_v3c8570 [Spiroplasma melliferum IPMB4A]KAI92262.1 hypothetical protein SPM_005935 [Spiroplasma melliferum KC3]